MEYKDTKQSSWKRRLEKFGEIWERFKRNKMALVSLIVIVILVIACASASLVADYDQYAINGDMSERLQGPSSEHIFGTDEFGRDIFVRILYGGRISLSIGVVVVAISVFFGCILGGLAGYYGGRVDTIIMRASDVLMAIPSTLLCISIVAALGVGIDNLIIAMVVANIPGYTRLVKATMLSVREMEYVEAARAIGLGDRRIIFKHIISNCTSPIIVNATMSIAGTIISAAGLSFIGLGIQPPAPEWGAMLSTGKAFIRTAPHLLVFPGVFIVIAVLAINLVGDGVRDALDPKFKN